MPQHEELNSPLGTIVLVHDYPCKDWNGIGRIDSYGIIFLDHTRQFKYGYFEKKYVRVLTDAEILEYKLT
jgi:hypothetical protein